MAYELINAKFQFRSTTAKHISTIKIWARETTSANNEFGLLQQTVYSTLLRALQTLTKVGRSMGSFLQIVRLDFGVSENDDIIRKKESLFIQHTAHVTITIIKKN